jgi:hypothetical protein
VWNNRGGDVHLGNWQEEVSYGCSDADVVYREMGGLAAQFCLCVYIELAAKDIDLSPCVPTSNSDIETS